jgi:hypothetical protein
MGICALSIKRESEPLYSRSATPPTLDMAATFPDQLVFPRRMRWLGKTLRAKTHSAINKVGSGKFFYKVVCGFIFVTQSATRITKSCAKW